MGDFVEIGITLMSLMGTVASETLKWHPIVTNSIPNQASIREYNRSVSITPERNNSLVCLQLLKEMNGSILASSPFAKKRKRHSVENPLITPQKSTKWKLYITPAERITLLLHKGGVASQ